MSGHEFRRAELIRPALNVGCMFDIQTGTYHIGKHGESILNGGLSNFEGLCALPNLYKTEIALFKAARVMSRYCVNTRTGRFDIHDTENTMQVTRPMRAMSLYDNLNGINPWDPQETRFCFSDATVYHGEEWFRDLRTISNERRSDKKLLIDTPFFNPVTGKYIQTREPRISLLDSLSAWKSSNIDVMYEKNDVGDKELNMINMKKSAAKSQMVEQMMGLTFSSGIFLQTTVHIGEQYEIGGGVPLKKLKFMRGNIKLKDAPEKFSFYTSNCWWCVDSFPLLDDERKVEFPYDENDNLKGDTDLIRLTIVNLRGKSGRSGMPFNIVVSQSDGINEHLTNYLYVKETSRFGIGGNLQNYHMDLYPDVRLSRKSIRRLCEEDELLQRALEITSEMLQLRHFHSIDEKYYITPAQLYSGLKEKGFDWKVLLNTRGWYTWNNTDPELKPFLSTMDLLRMYTGEYPVPYWYRDVIGDKSFEPKV